MQSERVGDKRGLALVPPPVHCLSSISPWRRWWWRRLLGVRAVDGSKRIRSKNNKCDAFSLYTTSVGDWTHNVRAVNAKALTAFVNAIPSIAMHLIFISIQPAALARLLWDSHSNDTLHCKLGVMVPTFDGHVHNGEGDDEQGTRVKGTLVGPDEVNNCGWIRIGEIKWRISNEIINKPGVYIN